MTKAFQKMLFCLVTIFAEHNGRVWIAKTVQMKKLSYLVTISCLVTIVAKGRVDKGRVWIASPGYFVAEISVVENPA